MDLRGYARQLRVAEIQYPLGSFGVQLRCPFLDYLELRLPVLPEKMGRLGRHESGGCHHVFWEFGRLGEGKRQFSRGRDMPARAQTVREQARDSSLLESSAVMRRVEFLKTLN